MGDVNSQSISKRRTSYIRFLLYLLTNENTYLTTFLTTYIPRLDEINDVPAIVIGDKRIPDFVVSKNLKEETCGKAEDTRLCGVFNDLFVGLDEPE